MHLWLQPIERDIKTKNKKRTVADAHLMIIIAVILLGSILGIIHKVKQERAQQTVSDSSWDITDKNTLTRDRN